MSTDVYVRPVANLATKVALDHSIMQRRTDLDRWAFPRGLYVSHSVFGSITAGFHEFVTVAAREADESSTEEALNQARQTTRLALELDARRALPRGLSGLLMAYQDLGRITAPDSDYQPLTSWDCLADAGLVFPAQLALVLDEEVAQGELSLVGRAWRLPALDVHHYCVVQLLEQLLGSDEPFAAVRPLRESGDIYATVNRYLYDIGVLVIAVITSYDPQIGPQVEALLTDFEPGEDDVDAARAAIRFRWRFGQAGAPPHAMAPYALLDHSVTLDEMERVLDGIGIDDLMAVHLQPSAPLRRRLSDGLV